MKSKPCVVLLWKEYRTQRGFWLALTAMGVVYQILFLLSSETNDQTRDMSFGLASTFPVIYALGCSCVLFGGEREEQTWPFLKAIAAQPVPVIASKTGFFLLSTCLMLVVLGLTACLVNLPAFLGAGPWSFSSKLWENSREIIQFGVLLPMHLLVFGIFFGLFMRKVIATVLATAVMSVISLFAIMRWTGPLGPIELHWHPPIWYWIALFSGFVGDIWIVSRQLSGPRDRSKSNREASAGGTEMMLYATGAVPLKSQVFRRLLWQEMRQSRWFVLLFAAVCALPIFTSLFARTHLLALFAVGTLPAMFGLMAFHSEQQDQRFRFWSERGFSPTAVWFTRHCFWLTLAIVITIGLGAAVFWVSQRNPHSTLHFSGPREFYQTVDAINSRFANPDDSLLVAGVLGFFCAYGIGQLMSMLVPRILIAGFLTFVLLALTGYWYLMTSLFGIPLWMSIAWIFPATMFATLLRTTDWGLDRRTWRARGKVLATLGLPFLFVICGTALYRVLEIPDRGVEYQELIANHPQSISDEALETAAMYREIDLGLPPQTNPNWYQDNRSQIPRLLAITERASCAIAQTTAPDGNPYENIGQFGNQLFRLLREDADRLIAEQKLEAAYSRYLAMLRMANHFAQGGGVPRWQASQDHVLKTYELIAQWASIPEQTSARILEAREEVEYQAVLFPPLSDAYLRDQRKYAAWISEQSLDQIIVPVGDSEDLYQPVLGSKLSRVFFWEKIRIERLLKAITVDHHLWIQHMETSTTKIGGDPTSGSLARITALPRQSWGEVVLDKNLDEAVRQRAMQLKLELLAYRADHGAFPESLEQLRDKYSFELPVDPWRGQPFQYLSGMTTTNIGQALLRPKSKGDRAILWTSAGMQQNPRVKVKIQDDTNSPPVLVLQSIYWGGLRERVLMSNHHNSPTNGYLFFVP